MQSLTNPTKTIRILPSVSRAQNSTVGQNMQTIYRPRTNNINILQNLPIVVPKSRAHLGPVIKTVPRIQTLQTQFITKPIAAKTPKIITIPKPPPIPQSSTDETYLIRIEMMDGTAQFVHLTEEQAMSLGVNKIEPDVEKVVKRTPTKLNYKIVQPAELNLGFREEPETPRKIESGLTRGRPRKRPLDETQSEEVSEGKIPKTIKDWSRTRSGRITKPPVHMEKDYEKIVTNIKPSLEPLVDLDTVEFEPLKTENTATEPPPLIYLKPNKKKRFIAGHYKCPTCQKIYLGRNRLAVHIKKNPDHDPGLENMNEDCDTWYYLIEIANKSNKGKRGEKFVKQLLNVIRNACIMAKSFLRPAGPTKGEYIVDKLLADTLKINTGLYKFNESALCKDVSIFSYLMEGSFMNEDNPKELGTISTNTSSNITQTDFNEPQTIEESTYTQVNSIPENIVSVQPTKTKPVTDLHFGSEIEYEIDVKSPRKDFIFKPTTHSSISVELASPKLVENNIEKNDFLNIFNDSFMEKTSFPTNSVEASRVLAPKLQETEQQTQLSKEINILSFDTGVTVSDISLDKDKKPRKSDEFDLNKLHLVEFLPDANVTNLDTSTGSDDIMNVDQFVNERFKNLTEHEVTMPDIGNSTMSLDMPALPCFNFNHT